MNVYVWRHNRKFHSFSMINEPCVQQHFYTDAVAIVVAQTIDEAIDLLVAKDEGWRPEDLKLLEPKVYTIEQAAVLFTDVKGE